MQPQDVLLILDQLADPLVAARKAKDFGILNENALGIYMKDLNLLAKSIGKNSDLALALIDTNIYEARILASKIFNKQDLTKTLMENWIGFFNTWEICDAYCMQLFKYSEASWELMEDWVTRKSEFEKRAGFVVMATYGQGHKETPNTAYEICYPIILQGAEDHRNFVKKAINWAIREIGKRNADLKATCIGLCEDLLLLDSKSANWIANDALKELSNPNVKLRNYPRSIYG